MNRGGPAFELLANLAVRTSDGVRRFARQYLAILLSPGETVAEAAAAGEWPFVLALIGGWSFLQAVLLRIAWPTAATRIGWSGPLAAGRVKVWVVLAAGLVFWSALILATVAGARLLGRERAGLLGAANCVAVAVVPLSALTVAAWIVLYLSPALAPVVLAFGLLLGLCYYLEAVRSEYNLPVGASLYGIPLMVVVALMAAGFFLLVLGAMMRGDVPALP